VADPTCRAWRPGDFALRVAIIGVFDLVTAGILLGAGTGPAIDAGSGAMFLLLAAVVLVTAVPTVVAIVTATTPVRVVLGADALTIEALPERGWLRPEISGRIPFRGLRAEWHRDEASTNLVLRLPAGDIALTSPGADALERIERALREHGVAIG
jgi:hypothetical protein